MSVRDDNFLAAIDARVDALRELVNRSLCKCTHGPTWRAYNGCPVHPDPYPMPPLPWGADHVPTSSSDALHPVAQQALWLLLGDGLGETGKQAWLAWRLAEGYSIERVFADALALMTA